MGRTVKLIALPNDVGIGEVSVYIIDFDHNLSILEAFQYILNTDISEGFTGYYDCTDIDTVIDMLGSASSKTWMEAYKKLKEMRSMEKYKESECYIIDSNG